MDLTFCELIKNGYIEQFRVHLFGITSARKKCPLSCSSVATYTSSITMIISTYMINKTEMDIFNGFLDDMLTLERKFGNNANFSMQSCAIRHFKDFILSTHEPEWPQSIVANTTCPTCLCGCDKCHPPGLGTCNGVIECFGKCGKLYPTCKMIESISDPALEEGICEYCRVKYKPLYHNPIEGVDLRRRLRHIEYVNDNALIGRSSSAKYNALIKMEILKNARWHCVKTHRCHNTMCPGWHSTGVL